MESIGRYWERLPFLSVQGGTHLRSCKQKDLTSRAAAPSDIALGNSSSPGHSCPQVSTPRAQREQEAGRSGSVGHGAELLMRISVILRFSRNMTKQSQIMKSATFLLFTAGFQGANFAPTDMVLIELHVCGWEHDCPCYRLVCST